MTEQLNFIKKSLFNKEPDDPLTIQEHLLLRSYETGSIHEDARIDIERDDFWDQMQAYAWAERNKEAVMEKLRRRLAVRWATRRMVCRLMKLKKKKDASRASFPDE